MEQIRKLCVKKLRSAANYALTFIRWTMLAAFTGAIGGFVGSLFHISVEYATQMRLKNSLLILFLPLGGLAIVGLYKICRVEQSVGTNQVIDAIRTENKPPLLLAPLIFVSTVITHLLGGSAGREGAALQLGGSIGSLVGRIFKLDEKDMHLIVMCGMSSVFSALFGTPLTAVLFAMEVISVGLLYYSAAVPCIAASITAFGISKLFGITPLRFNIGNVPDFGIDSIWRVALLAIGCALLSILFCAAMRYSHKLFAKLIKNEFLRAAIGGIAIIILTFLLGTYDYNGAGMNVIEKAIGGQANTFAFLLKILFTAITIGTGFKGGEIVPTMFIGATFGCVFGGLLGLPPGFGAAVGLVALFCGVVNCPTASVFLSVELFGTTGLLLFAIACAVSYMLSGYYGLYSSQKIVYSKLKAEYININAK